MGMHAGWLALASALGEPDFVLLPEFPIEYNPFLDLLIKKYQKEKHVIVVISEGARWIGGGYVHAEKDEFEEFEHPRFGGAADALKTKLKQDLTKYFPTRNINSVNPSYLYRSGAPNALDRQCASRLGVKAVRDLLEGLSRPTFLSVQKTETDYEIDSIPLNRFASIAELHRFVDDRFYDPQEFRISEYGRNYISSIVPEIPREEAYLEFLRSK
jgi:6-phosphofructokinase 1